MYTVYIYIYVYMHVYIYIYIYIYIQYSMTIFDTIDCSNCPKTYFGKEPVQFDSVRFGSVRTIIYPASMRFGLRFSEASWLGPVRFVSTSGSGRFRN